jgi:hypothetical protein
VRPDGTIPFAGTLTDLLLHKNPIDPPAASELMPDVPADLSTICMGLLRRDPGQRLPGPSALRALTPDATPPRLDAMPAPIRDAPFVGRDDQLRALNEAFQTVANGSAAAVSVSGPSGIGKSALVRCFLGRIAERDVVVLSGRCYENESVPYKALDGVVDDLSRHLASLPRQDVEPLLPPDVPALTRVFPVLLQVHAVAAVRRDQKLESAGPFRLRRRAFDALRGLPVVSPRASCSSSASATCSGPTPTAPCCSRSCCAAGRTGDADTAVLPQRGNRPRNRSCARWSNGPAGHLVGDFTRSAAGRRRAGVDRRAAAGRLGAHRRRQTSDDARGGRQSIRARAVVARYAGVNHGRSQPPTFAEMLRRGSVRSTEARRFRRDAGDLRPADGVRSALRCAASPRERQSLVAGLRASRFVRSSGSSERIETYHDRIRDVLAADVAPDAVRLITAA